MYYKSKRYQDYSVPFLTGAAPRPGVEGSKHKECEVCGEALETEVIEALPEVTEPETEPETEPGTEPSATETQPAEKKKKGCASAVQTGLLLLMIAILPVVTVRRKKETE